MQKINENNQSIYCYEGTSILINKKNIMDKEVLEKLDLMITTYKLSKIIGGEGDFERNLTIEHYLNIHKYLFEDIYPFAGKIREEFTNKRNDCEIPGEPGIRIYCNPDFIYNCLKEQLFNMKNEALKIKSRDDLLDFLTKNYLELYFIHPFREGNSRTLREFMREYVEIMNKLLFKFGSYEIEYSQLNNEDKTNFVKSVIWNTSDDKEKQAKSYSILREVLDKCVVEKKLDKTK